MECFSVSGRACVCLCILWYMIYRHWYKNCPGRVSLMRLRLWPYCCSFCFQEQYVFCYKVWLDVLQSISLLHGNQWQSETPLWRNEWVLAFFHAKLFHSFLSGATALICLNSVEKLLYEVNHVHWVWVSVLFWSFSIKYMAQEAH